MTRTHLLTAALATAMTASTAFALSVAKVSEATRPSFTEAAQISGVTWAGGDLYYAVDDYDNKLYPLTLAIDRTTGSLASSGITIGTGVVMSGGQDMEGCAFDPCSGKVWISDEGHYRNYSPTPFIREFDPATGAASRSAPIHALQYDRHGNFSFEALTISGDGKTMWTANEEALKGDGMTSTQSAGSTVRLTKYVRSSLGADWTLAGEWAYLTQPVGSAPVVWNNDVKSRSGVAGLCALPDGTLLVLERNLHGRSVFSANFYTKIYQVDFTGATDVSNLPGLTGASYTGVRKTQLFGLDNVRVNYEGICLGPRLDDGSCVLVLVADGGGTGSPARNIMTLKLSGLEIRTMYFVGPEGCEPSGGPYRFFVGEKVDFQRPDAENPDRNDGPCGVEVGDEHNAGRWTRRLLDRLQQ